MQNWKRPVEVVAPPCLPLWSNGPEGRSAPAYLVRGQPSLNSHLFDMDFLKLSSVITVAIAAASPDMSGIQAPEPFLKFPDAGFGGVGTGLLGVSGFPLQAEFGFGGIGTGAFSFKGGDGSFRDRVVER